MHELTLLLCEAPYPSIVTKVKAQLRYMRKVGAPVSLVDVRAILVAHISIDAPELFEDGTFRVSDGFVYKFIEVIMDWSHRMPTKAAQKLPQNADELTFASVMRLCLAIRDNTITAALRVNSDQTNVIYQGGSRFTYNQRGAKQVAVVGEEEKRAFTVFVGVSASGVALPFQVIFKGKSRESLPRRSSPLYDEAVEIGMRFEFSNTDTYWSTLQTMKDYVIYILVPYFKTEMIKADIPLDYTQICIWQIDVWSVHKSKAFREWMAEHYPWIQLEYVPGGCTGIWQACDVGIQRPLKKAIRHVQHADVVAETVDALQNGMPPEKMRLDTRVGTLRDRVPGWLVPAFHAINQESLIKQVSINSSNEENSQLTYFQAFTMCTNGPFNLSQDSLTSREAKTALLGLKKTHPKLWAELNKNGLPSEDEDSEEEKEEGEKEKETEPPFNEDDEEDDSAVPMADVVKDVMSNRRESTGARYVRGDSGQLISTEEVGEITFEHSDDVEEVGDGDDDVGDEEGDACVANSDAEDAELVGDDTDYVATSKDDGQEEKAARRPRRETAGKTSWYSDEALRWWVAPKQKGKQRATEADEI